MQNLTSAAPFRSGRGLAKALTFALGANIAVSVVSALSTLAKIVSGAASHVPSEEDDISVFDFIDLGVGLLYLAVFVATVVLFCMWLYRAHKNLPALGNPKQAIQRASGWVVGSFFVPFANLVIPFLGVKEAWAKSDPEVTDDNYVAPSDPPAPSTMKLWWGLWLVSNFVNNAAFRVHTRASTSQGFLAATWLDLIGDLLSIPAAAFAILVVREIDRRQEERAKRVTHVVNAPPPPPVFYPPQPHAAS